MSIQKLVESKSDSNAIIERLTSGRVPIPGEILICMIDTDDIKEGDKITVLSCTCPDDNTADRVLIGTKEDGSSVTLNTTQDVIDLNFNNMFAS